MNLLLTYQNVIFCLMFDRFLIYILLILETWNCKLTEYQCGLIDHMLLVCLDGHRVCDGAIRTCPYFQHVMDDHYELGADTLTLNDFKSFMDEEHNCSK